MIEEGAGAPEFTLPAVVGDEIEPVSLSDYLGRSVVVLAFYPGDFDPACDGRETALDELDLFTMQKDVSILGISGDSVFSHRAFADEYDLHVPLLTDVDGTVAEDYGVTVEDAAEVGYRTKRAVVVIAPRGDVEFVWATDDLQTLPPVDRVRQAVDDVGGAETARARYRVGHAHYVEGRRAFTSAMHEFGDNEWMMAESDFRRAYDEFDEAAAHFNTAVRFGDADLEVRYFELAEDKAELLWQAAEWLAESAHAYASGEGLEGESMRSDAEAPLEEARRYVDPPDPDEFPPAEPPPEPATAGADEGSSFLPADDGDVDTSLDADFEEAGVDDDLRESVTDRSGDGDTVSGESTAAPGGGSDPSESGQSPEEEWAAATGTGIGSARAGDEGADDEGTDDEAGEEDDADDGGADAIDDAELEEITAELEQQTEQAQAMETGATSDANAGRETTDESVGGDGGTVDDGDAAAESAVDETVEELELTDPTDGEGLAPLEDEEDEDDESGDDDLGDGGHGVPDSL